MVTRRPDATPLVCCWRLTPLDVVTSAYRHFRDTPTKTASIGVDDFQANRSPDRGYRTSPLRGLFAHTKGGFFHDGRFATLLDVINHYNTFFSLGLTETEKSDLLEYLKSL
jgi:cytochrome c peroxidase